jgi:hypothetical protein
VVTDRERGGRGVDVGKHREGIDRARVDDELVAGITTCEEGRVTESAAQPGHLRLQGVPAGVGGAVTPEVLDQPVGADETPGIEREPHEELGTLAARDLDELAVAPDRNRAEHRNLQHVESVRATDAGSCLHSKVTQ